MNPPLQNPQLQTFPRVLIVYHSCINLADQHGVSIRGWFSKWPRENLAQIYSGQESGDGEFCNSSYKLTHRDRWFGKLFFWLKGSTLGEASIQVIKINNHSPLINKPKINGQIKRILGRFFLGSGLWEFIFKPKLSVELVNWVEQFKPDIIYCQGYTLGFTWLPLMLSRRFGIPICFQTGDDWPFSLYRGSPIALLVRPVVRVSAKRLIRNASLRFANGPDMAEVYFKRYQVPFEPMMMCDDYNRFNSSKPIRTQTINTVSIVYSGSLGGGRWKPLADVCLAADELRAEGFEVKVTGFVSSGPPEAIEYLNAFENFKLLPAPSHEDLPMYLKGADLLFLPEPFNSERDNDIQLSISTKAHLYMMSERPALIYAPETAGIMKYSMMVDWGCRVFRPDQGLLKDALRTLITDKNYCQKLTIKGRKIALEMHDSTIVCERLRRRIQETVSA